MALFFLDTTTITHLQRNHPKVTAALAAHVGHTVAICSVNVEESLGGWLNLLPQVRTPAEQANVARLLTESVAYLARFPLVPITEAALHRFAVLKKLKLNVGRNDLRLGAMALESTATVVTNNAIDFGRIPGVAWVDWTV